MHQVDDTRRFPMNEAEMQRVAAEIELRRRRNRMHQAKHKMKQQKKVLDLEIGIRQLRDEIQQLKLQKEVVSSRRVTNRQSGVSQPSTFVSSGTGTRPYGHIESFHHGIPDGIASGLPSLLENWRQLSTYHENMEIDLVRLDVGPDDNLIATVRSATTMSEKALRHGFPHLFENGQWTRLGARLLGQRIVMNGAVSFVWDAEKDRVSSIQYSVTC
ncbi:hypothetical protein GQ600_9741 [Phytophthora cactorum]|nr:hypothetical protein GQ600_9741 [Phytophthora cactorum]